MKKILYILTAAIFMLTSCEKPKSVVEQLAGDWHCTSSAIDAEIYATFNADKTFILYQQIGEGAFRVYNGTYEIKTNVNAGEDSVASNHILTGTYNDGKSWGAEYAFAITEDVMTMTAGGITETYERVSGGIPEAVLASCVTVVKSKGDLEVPFL